MSSPRRRASDGGAVVLTGGRGGAGSGPVTLSGDALVIDVDAREIVDAARRASLRVLSEQIREGVRPDGAPHKPLSDRAESSRRVSDHRGFKTGHLADELRASPIKGGASSAESTIYPPTDRNVVLAGELARGNVYFATGPRLEAEVSKAIEAVVEAQLEGRKIGAEGGEPRAVDERGS